VALLAMQVPPPAASAQLPPLIIVMLENLGYSGVVGNTAMPYFNALWNEGQDGTGPVTDYTQMYAVAHPSLPNYQPGGLRSGLPGRLPEPSDSVIAANVACARAVQPARSKGDNA